MLEIKSCLIVLYSLLHAERASILNQFLDVPPGFWSNGVVPYETVDGRPVLLPIAAVRHLTNAYTSRPDWPTPRVEDYFI